jgi:hypothetical protein
MSASDLLQLLRDQRGALLACEAIGWLHMSGKAHPDFLRQQASDATASTLTWDELKWATSLYARFGLLPPIGAQSISVQDLLERHRERSDGVLGLLQAAHAMASGIEKNSPADYQKQPSAQTWLSTAFGHPAQNLLVNGPAILASDAWTTLEKDVGTLIDALAMRLKDANDLAAWINWRDGAVGPSGWLREAFTSTLAETRVPNNDVTLWDQSFIAAALFKAAVAGAVLCGSTYEWGNGVKANTRWRVLTVGIGAEHYEARAVRIGDWTGTRDTIAAFFDEVCSFIEVELALGACVYRDERVLSFTFPGYRLDGRGSVDDALAKDLQARIESHIDKLAQWHAFETPPLVLLSSSTRSLIAMSRELIEARSVLEVPVHRPWSIATDGSTGKHVCPVSLIRAGQPSNTQSNRKQDVSRTCYDRRIGRRSSWEKSGGDTIWISEVADENDRVALLTFSLGLDGWLDGTNVDSLRAQSVVEWRVNNPQLTAIDAESPRDSFRTHTEDFVRRPTMSAKGTLTNAALSTLNDGFVHERQLQDFFHKVVEDRAGSPAWTSLDDAARAAWLTHQLFRKNASPGRVHRFWRTTQAFFSEVLAELRCIVSRAEGPRTERLSLNLAGDVSGLRSGEVYAGHLPCAPTAPFEILRRAGDSVTVCNLARVLRVGKGASELVGVTFEARGDDGQRRTLTINKAITADAPLQSYCPLIVLEENPERFRVLVPLASAAACVDHVVAKWGKEMARAWDRLPLRIGIIAFPRKTPFQAVIEATRNVADDLGFVGTETWRVAQVDAQTRTTALTLVRPDNGYEHVEVPTQLPDGRNDVYYPNLAVEGLTRAPHDFPAPRPDGSSSTYRWVAELQQGDSIKVESSRFATVFLDSTARRFEPIRARPLSEWQRRQRVWQLVKAAASSSTAARAVEQALCEARERWTDPNGTLDEQAWRDWIHAVLANEWNANANDLKELEETARSGLLEEVLSWHLHVLKQTNTGENYE